MVLKVEKLEWKVEYLQNLSFFFFLWSLKDTLQALFSVCFVVFIPCRLKLEVTDNINADWVLSRRRLCTMFQGLLSAPWYKGSVSFKVNLGQTRYAPSHPSRPFKRLRFPRARSADSMKNELLMSDFHSNRIILPNEQHFFHAFRHSFLI